MASSGGTRPLWIPQLPQAQTSPRPPAASQAQLQPYAAKPLLSEASASLGSSAASAGIAAPPAAKEAEGFKPGAVAEAPAGPVEEVVPEGGGAASASGSAGGSTGSGAGVGAPADAAGAAAALAPATAAVASVSAPMEALLREVTVHGGGDAGTAVEAEGAFQEDRALLRDAAAAATAQPYDWSFAASDEGFRGYKTLGVSDLDVLSGGSAAGAAAAAAAAAAPRPRLGIDYVDAAGGAGEAGTSAAVPMKEPLLPPTPPLPPTAAAAPPPGSTNTGPGYRVRFADLPDVAAPPRARRGAPPPWTHSARRNGQRVGLVEEEGQAAEQDVAFRRAVSAAGAARMAVVLLGVAAVSAWGTYACMQRPQTVMWAVVSGLVTATAASLAAYEAIAACDGGGAAAANAAVAQRRAVGGISGGGGAASGANSGGLTAPLLLGVGTDVSGGRDGGGGGRGGGAADSGAAGPV